MARKTTLLTLSLGLLLACTTLSGEDQKLTYEQLADRSELWPTYVHLNEPIEVQHEGQPRTLDKGRRAVLTRFEDGKFFVDFGREGIHIIDPRKTDVLAQAQAYASGDEQKTAGLVISHIGNRLFRHMGEEKGYRQIQAREFLPITRYLFLYVDADSEATTQATPKLREFYQKLRTEHPYAEMPSLPFAEDQAAFDRYLKENPLPWPVMPLYLSLGYRHALHHNPQGLELVLTDADFKVLARSSDPAFEGDLDKFLAEAKELIAQAG